MKPIYCYHLDGVWGILKLTGQQLHYNLTVKSGAPGRSETKTGVASLIEKAKTTDDLVSESNSMHWLFDEVLALLSGQENSGAFSQPADERHLLATVAQLQSFNPGYQCVTKTIKKQNQNKCRICTFLHRNSAEDSSGLTLPLTVLTGPHCSLYWPPTGSQSRLTCCPQTLCYWLRCPEKSCERSCCRCPSLPNLLRPAQGTTGSLLWWRHVIGLSALCDLVGDSYTVLLT